VTFLLRAVTLLVVLSCASLAEARVVRFSIVVGNNVGAADDGRLRYAESDAQRVHDTLRQLGGFEAKDSTLLLAATADEVRRTLIAINDRIRAEASPDTQAVLVFYYSGHADAAALHLAGSLLALPELVQLVRGSAAQFRLLVLDACQSGAVTRRKRGRHTAAFALPAEPSLPGEGVALLTASSADEDAQESDQLQGSFFTHALVSGLLGAADGDRDGAVVLEEAYRYAYDATLRSTSRTAAGTQHPSFSYDLRGQGDLVLTRPGLRDAQRGLLQLPRGASYLVLRDGAEGAVVAEVGERDEARRLSLRAGRYFVRGRTPRALLEGAVEVRAGAETHVDPGSLTRIDYARLVRKGSGVRTRVQAIEAGGHVRTGLRNASTGCAGAYASYRVDLELLSVAGQLGYCRSALENRILTADIDEISAGVRVLKVWDPATRVSLELGLGALALGLFQRFETEGRAPARSTPAGGVEAIAASSLVLGRGMYMRMEATAQGLVIRMLDAERERGRLEAQGAARIGLGLGKAW
jgi:hypothetical protein